MAFFSDPWVQRLKNRIRIHYFSKTESKLSQKPDPDQPIIPGSVHEPPVFGNPYCPVAVSNPQFGLLRRPVLIKTTDKKRLCRSCKFNVKRILIRIS